MRIGRAARARERSGTTTVRGPCKEGVRARVINHLHGRGENRGDARHPSRARRRGSNAHTSRGRQADASHIKTSCGLVKNFRQITRVVLAYLRKRPRRNKKVKKTKINRGRRPVDEWHGLLHFHERGFHKVDIYSLDKDKTHSAYVRNSATEGIKELRK